MKKYCLFLFTLFSPLLFGVTITIENDSTYTLQATIYSASDEPLSDMEIPPNQSFKWQDSFFDSKDYSKGPFRVEFTCPNGTAMEA